MAANVFVAYSHHDESFKSDLETHTAVLNREGLLDLWHDRRIRPGEDWDERITSELEAADLILLLVSPDFLASSYCYGREATRALERHAESSAIVIPIILRPCQWLRTPLSQLQALPADGTPISEFGDRDDALLQIADSIAGELESIERVRPDSETAAVTGDETYSPSGLVALRLNSLQRLRPPEGSMFLVAPDYAIGTQSFIAGVLQVDPDGAFEGVADVSMSVSGGYFAPLDLKTYPDGPRETMLQAPFKRALVKIYPDGTTANVVLTATAEGFGMSSATVRCVQYPDD